MKLWYGLSVVNVLSVPLQDFLWNLPLYLFLHFHIKWIQQVQFSFISLLPTDKATVNPQFLSNFIMFCSHKTFLKIKKTFPHYPVGCWQWCVVAGLTPASRNCNIISYWFLVDLPWSSHHSVMCSTRLLNEINSPPAKQKSNRTLWELNAITEGVWGNICRLKTGFSLSLFIMNHNWGNRIIYFRF